MNQSNIKEVLHSRNLEVDNTLLTEEETKEALRVAKIIKRNKERKENKDNFKATNE